MLIDIALIRLDGGTQSRAALDNAVVADYAAKLSEGHTFPPVVLWFDGESYWPSDGFHRMAAHRSLGLAEIDAEVRQGTRRDAVLHSCGANAAHGLRRSNADKRRSVETLLRDAEWSQWSNRETARLCGVSHEFVSQMREQVATVASHTEEPQAETEACEVPRSSQKMICVRLCRPEYEQLIARAKADESSASELVRDALYSRYGVGRLTEVNSPAV